MDPASLLRLALSISILLLVTGLGMRAKVGDALSFFQRILAPPRSLLRAIFAMNFVVPIAAAAIASAFYLPQAVKVGIVAMSIAPVPPILPAKQLRFGGRERYVHGLLVAVSLAAIVFVPVSVEVLGRLVHRDVHMGFLEMARLMARTVLLPLAVGMAIRHFLPNVAARVVPVLLRTGNVLLLAGLTPVLVASAPRMWTLIGNGTILTMAAVVVVAIAAGHWIGGPDEHDRTALGLVSAMRHPGVALAIGTTNFPDNQLVPAAVLLFVLVAATVTTIYGKWRLRRYSL